MIKIINILEEGRGGGPLFQTARLAKHLTGKINMIVIAPASAKNYHADLLASGVTSMPIELHPLTKTPNGLYQYIMNFREEVRELTNIILEEHPDLIHVNGAYQIKGLLAAKRAKVPVIWYMNDTYQPASIRRLFRWISSKADHFIYASKRSQDYYSDIAPNIKYTPQTIIPAPVDTEIYYPRSASVISRKKPFDIATVGYVNIHKGLEYLIEAADRLQDVSVRFHLIGPVLDSQKKYASNLERLSKRLSNFYWHNFNSDTSSFLRDMDLYVCSSIRESSPMAVWEAMASGIPIVSTDVGDVRHLLDTYNCGISVPTHSGTALSEGILKILQLDREELKSMGQRSRHAMEENMSLEVVCNQYVNYINSIL